MSEINEYSLQLIHAWVWSGFYHPDDVQALIDEILDADSDEPLLRRAVGPEFARKAAAEAEWPAQTDCDRLDAAFAELNTAGIVALHNAGYTMAEGIQEVAVAMRGRGLDQVCGYCFYHGNDVERAVLGSDLLLAFGDLRDEPEAKAAIGWAVQQTLLNQGLEAEWDGNPEARIRLVNFLYQRRGP